MALNGFIQKTFCSNACVSKSYILIRFIALMIFLQVTGNRLSNYLYTEFCYYVNASSNSKL